MDVSGISLKEAVELMEERIPFGLGRPATTTVLMALFLAIFIASVRYIVDATAPVGAAIVGFARTGHWITPDVHLGDLLVAAFILMGGYFMKRTLAKLLNLIDGLFRYAKRLEARVAAIESKVGIGLGQNPSS